LRFLELATAGKMYVHAVCGLASIASVEHDLHSLDLFQSEHSYFVPATD
jgi:hypothetical protein